MFVRYQHLGVTKTYVNPPPFCSVQQPASVDSITEGDRQALMAAELPASSTYSGVNMSYHLPQTGMMRRSLPNMAHSMLVHEPAKIYPYHLLLITNYRLPVDVDRCNLEVSTSGHTRLHHTNARRHCWANTVPSLSLPNSATCRTLNSRRYCSVRGPSSIACRSGVATKSNDGPVCSKRRASDTKRPTAN